MEGSPHRDAYADFHPHSYAYRDCDSYAHANIHPNSYSDSHAHAHRDADSYPDFHAYPDPDPDGYSHAYSDPNADSYADSDPRQFPNVLLERYRRAQPVEQSRARQRLRRVDVREEHAARHGEPELELPKRHRFVGRHHREWNTAAGRRY